jgi:hypothetical protein
MKIEHIIKSTIPFDDAKKVFLNFTYTQNVIGDKFNEILKPYDISREQYCEFYVVKKVVQLI